MRFKLMSRWKALVALCASCVALAIVMLSVTHASGGEENCGSELIGGGSTLQEGAQKEVWGPGWNGGECTAKPTVTYNATSSGLALEQWGANSGVLGGKGGPNKPFPMFIATEIAPEGSSENAGTQIYNMVKAGRWGESEYPNEVMTVPVAQSAIAVIVSLPKGCKVESGTPAVKSKVLEEEWEKGTIAFKTLIAGVTLSGKSCEEVKKEGASLQPILEARSNASGATAALKRYLAMVGPEKNEFKALTANAEKSANTEWPKTLPAGYPSETLNGGDSSLAKNVSLTAGSIGYVGLADAIAAGFSKTPAELGPQATGYQSFFVEVQNNAKESTEPTYASPEGEKASNCSGAEYREPPSEAEPEADWSQVIDKNVEAGKKTNYPICTLMFDVTWPLMDMPEVEGKALYSEENEAAVYSYLRYIVATKAEEGGQNKSLEEKHYAMLPAAIQEAAAEGLSLGARPPGAGAVAWPTVNLEGAGKEGPGKGRPWVATLGDSYISGESGRWAGNARFRSKVIDALGSTAYYDKAGHGEEEIKQCHRSAAAEAYINLVSNPPEVASVNLACSGAETTSMLENGRFFSGLDSQNLGGANKGQVLLLKEFAENHNVKLIVISIGGNNFGFAKVVERCVLDYVESTVAVMRTCRNDPIATANFTPANIKAVETKVQEAIERVKAAMAAAGYNNQMYSVAVQNYEAVIPEGKVGVNDVEGFRDTENRYVRQRKDGCGFWNTDANWANRTVAPAINNAVHRAAVAAAPPNLQLLDFKEAFLGRRLCEKGIGTVGKFGSVGVNLWNEVGAVDKTEWVNEIRALTTRKRVRRLLLKYYFTQEAFHPNYWGELALRNCLRQVYNGGVPKAGACKRVAFGLLKGEPQMKLQPVQGFVGANAGSAKGKGHSFSLGKATVKCEEANLKWKLVGQSPTLELTPEYGTCTAANGEAEVAAKVALSGCTYTLSGAAGSETLQAWMALPKGCVIELGTSLSGGCTMKIEGPQEVETVKMANLNTTTGSLESEIDPEALALEFTSVGEGCAAAGIPKEGLGSYEGKTVGKGLIVEEPGAPLWNTRPIGETAGGVNVSEGSPEKIQVKGGQIKLNSKVGGEAAVIGCSESKGDGILYNSRLAGQDKLRLSLAKCTTTLKHCAVVEPITVHAGLSLMWKWNGVKANLSQGKQQTFGQKLSMLMSHSDLSAGVPKAEEELASISLKKDGVGTCASEGAPLVIKGYEAADLEPNKIEQFSKELKLSFTPGKHRQHYWNGAEQAGLETTLKLGSEPAELAGSITMSPIKTEADEEQEAAVYEG